MVSKRSYQRFVLLSIVMIVSGMMAWNGIAVQHAKGDSRNDSPLPTPITSPYAQVAIKYLAQKYKIPEERLVVEYEVAQEYPLSSRTFQYFKISDGRAPGSTTFNALVDVVTNKVEEDLHALEATEAAAYRAKFGKLHVTLSERLQNVTDDTVLPVAIWVAGHPVHNEQEIYAIITREFPAALAAIAKGRKLFEVDDPEMANKIQTRYEELLAENTNVRTQPVQAWLEAQGYKWQSDGAIPAVYADLPKTIILKLAQLEAVGLIYLVETKGQQAMDTATSSDRSPVNWRAGYIGTNVKVAIIDTGKIDTGTSCLTLSDTKDASLGADAHKTKTASIVACNSDPYRGVAYGATLADAGFTDPGGTTGRTNMLNALKWATDTTRQARVVNLSYGWEEDQNINDTDRAVDYWIRNRSFVMTVAAGNHKTYVISPGKAWNVITVGGTNDQGTANWSDDGLYDDGAFGTNYIDPTGGESGSGTTADREKPEVVAPAQNITVCCSGNNAAPSGTSYAAPQVAGLAALLIQRNSQLHSATSKWPEAVKAIIMASAVHNIEGDQQLSEYDGAGAIDAALADQAAQFRQTTLTTPCNTPCWWGTVTSSGSPGIGSALNTYFNATRGERIRVAIAWMANADSDTNNYSFDRLDTDFDLRVYTQGNTLVKTSLRYKNNYELVDFDAPETTTYRIEVKKQSANENNNSLGIAWVKDATYLPDIRRNSGGWNSSIYVRNDDSTARDVKVTFVNPDGTFAGEQTSTGLYPTGLPKDAVWSGATPPSNWQGSAIVDGGEGLSVVARLDGPGFSSLDNGFLMGGATDPAFEQSGATLYVPAIYNNIFGGLNSTLYVQNVSSTDANVTLNWYGRSGYLDYTSTYIIAKGGRIAIAASSVLGGGAWVGSLRIASNQPVAAKVLETSGATTSRSFNAAAGGRSLVYVPAAYKNEFGFNTGLVIQNLDTVNDANVIVTYCNRTATSCIPETAFTLKPLRATGINVGASTVLPAKWSGSVKIENASGTPARPLAVAVTNSNSVGGYDFNGNGSADAGKVLFLPRAAKNASGRTTGFTVRNVSGGTVTVTAFYYNADGTLRPSSDRHVDTLTSAQTLGYHQSNDTFLADGWQGSIVLQASGAIVAVMREDSADTVSGYNGISH